MEDARPRVQWVDAARGTAIALVVLHHASARSTRAGAAEWWLHLGAMLQTVRMPLFFTVAGIVAVRWVGRRTGWPELLRGKVLLLVWVYLVWLVLRYAWFLLLPGGRTMTPYAELVERLWWPAGGWFLVALAAMFVVAKAMHRLPPLPVLVGAGGVSAAFLGGWVDVGNLAWDGVGAYTFFFLLGASLRDPILAAADALTRSLAATLVLVWVAGYLVVEDAGLGETPGVALVLRLLGVAAGVGVALLLRRWAALRALGRGTLSVYLAHQLLVVTAVAWLASRWDFREDWVLHQAAPLLLAVVLVPTTYWLGRVAPRVGLGWVFSTPGWLVRATGRRPGAGGREPVGGGRAGL